jgi:hypothetical protein
MPARLTDQDLADLFIKARDEGATKGFDHEVAVALGVVAVFRALQAEQPLVLCCVASGCSKVPLPGCTCCREHAVGNAGAEWA